jgi:hypothetical protein
MVMTRVLAAATRCALLTGWLATESMLLPALAVAEGLEDRKQTTQSAVAQFRTPDVDPCVQTDVDVFVIEAKTRSDALGDSAEIATLIEIHRFNHCAAICCWVSRSVRPI